MSPCPLVSSPGRERDSGKDDGYTARVERAVAGAGIAKTLTGLSLSRLRRVILRRRWLHDSDRTSRGRSWRSQSAFDRLYRRSPCHDPLASTLSRQRERRTENESTSFERGATSKSSKNRKNRNPRPGSSQSCRRCEPMVGERSQGARIARIARIARRGINIARVNAHSCMSTAVHRGRY